MKIAVYAIALNEIKHAERWAEATKDADYRVVLDTGSTDGTQEALREAGVTVYQGHIKPWRFDSARNAALALVPDDADACVILDLDEITEPGFFDEVRKNWNDCDFMWITMDTGNKWQRDRVHSRWGWNWRFPCHEVQTWYKEDVPRAAMALGAVIRHEPDTTKSRGQYLQILEMAVKEFPTDARMWTYMTREYYYHQRWEDVLKAADTTLALQGWNVEQAATCKWAGEAAYYLNKPAEEVTAWYDRGAQILPTEGEPWYGVAIDAYRRKDWQRCLDASIKVLETPRSVHYCYESAVWDWKAYDLAAVSSYNLGFIDEAITFARHALRGNGPEQERIQRNLDFMEGLKKNAPRPSGKNNKVRSKR